MEIKHNSLEEMIADNEGLDGFDLGDSWCRWSKHLSCCWTIDHSVLSLWPLREEKIITLISVSLCFWARHRLACSQSTITVRMSFGAWEEEDTSVPLSQAPPGSVHHSVVLKGAERCWKESSSLLQLLLLHQPSVMWHDFALREVERHLQGDQDGELKRYQLPPADPETLLQLL